MDAFEEGTALPSINSFLLRTCVGLNISLLQSHRSIDFLNLSSILNAQKGVTGGVLRTIPRQRLGYQVRNWQRKQGEKRPREF